jgi:hypothetical protein
MDENEDDQSLQAFNSSCNICFSNDADIFLVPCDDQFCRDCLSKYVTELIQQSWGLVELKIKCPICEEIIDSAQWQDWIDDQSIIDLFYEYNSDERTIVRFSPCCQQEVTITKIVQASEERDKITKKLLSRMNAELNSTLDLKVFSDASSQYNRDELTGQQFYSKFLQLFHLENSVDNFDTETIPNYVLLQQFSADLISVLQKVEKRRELEFLHIRSFPKMSCPDCDQYMCFKCGDLWHEGRSCEKNIQQKINNPYTAPNEKQTYEWQLQNSKRCPNCSIVFQKNEGCMHVHCVYCGYEFCFGCLSRWGNRQCGFYQCTRNQTEKPNATDTTITTSTTTTTTVNDNIIHNTENTSTVTMTHVNTQQVINV